MDNVDLFIKERVEMNETLSFNLSHLSSEKFMFICRETGEIGRQWNSNEEGALILFYSWHGNAE